MARLLGVAGVTAAGLVGGSVFGSTEEGGFYIALAICAVGSIVVGWITA
jgi:hypothetical protein